jgi:hypothetical protein
MVAAEADEQAVEALGGDLPFVELGARHERPVDLAGREHVAAGGAARGRGDDAARVVVDAEEVAGRGDLEQLRAEQIVTAFNTTALRSERQNTGSSVRRSR